ncbi:helix-turn-helix domain-containing protein [Streptomyces sp. NPDC058701]|uniref:helix-turn-helix domain-containing protein n=1 Tax=Streptomyces sp. NPDC058701 TaxID=3346608 RepID=UPI00364DAE18
MALQKLSAPSRASSRERAGVPATGGIVHVKARHTEQYTVVGNHLAQHRALSLTARGLALYIQSLPTGAKVGIKRLTDRFPEGEVRIASALRELEAHGYLERSRVRLASGQVVTRTVSYNRPQTTRPGLPERSTPPATRREPAVPPERGEDAVRRSRPVAEPVPVTVAGPVSGPPPVPGRGGAVVPGSGVGAKPSVEPGAEPAPPPDFGPWPECEPCFDLEPEPEPPPADPWSWPEPRAAVPEAASASAPARAAGEPPGAALRQDAVELLARLREDDPRLLLPERHVRRLAPGVSAWLERGAEPEAVRHVLAGGLPAELRNPAGLIAHRLATQVPPRLAPRPAGPPAARPDPMQNCDGCERAFRAPRPGRCRDCPEAAADSAA